jgi:hypothetical protein
VRIARRRLLVVTTFATALGSARPAGTAVPAPVEIWKLRGCGCCTLWARHLEAEGFTTRTSEYDDLAPIRAALGIPETLAGCHSARLDDLLIEGHVPALAIRRLLAARPSWVRGLAVPGMPAGSPGMPAPKPERYDVLAFGTDGRVERFMTFSGERPA